jgi:hypothetical protein
MDFSELARGKERCCDETGDIGDEPHRIGINQTDFQVNLKKHTFLIKHKPSQNHDGKADGVSSRCHLKTASFAGC